MVGRPGVLISTGLRRCRIALEPLRVAPVKSEVVVTSPLLHEWLTTVSDTVAPGRSGFDRPPPRVLSGRGMGRRVMIRQGSPFPSRSRRTRSLARLCRATQRRLRRAPVVPARDVEAKRIRSRTSDSGLWRVAGRRLHQEGESRTAQEHMPSSVGVVAGRSISGRRPPSECV